MTASIRFLPQRSLRRRSKLRVTLPLCFTLLTLFLVGCASGGPFAGSSHPSSPESGPILLTVTADHILLGEKDAIRATQNGVAVAGGTWQVAANSASGTIDSAGVYTAPAVLPNPNLVPILFKYGGTTASTSLTIENPEPSLLSATPASLMMGTTSVLFKGESFVNGVVVKINGSPIATTYVNSETLSASVAVAPGTSGSLLVTAANPFAGGALGSSLVLPIAVPTISVSPGLLVGGATTFTVTGTDFTKTSVVILDGKELPTTLTSSNTLLATGYVAPWKSGQSTVGVAPVSGTSQSEQVSVPIQATAVSYDVASRFATQAAFGPRHDTIERIQQIGLDPFITEQMQQPPIAYDEYAPCCGPRQAFLNNATSGSSLLRARVSMALQSFIVQQGLYVLPTLIPWQHKMEADAFGNFEQVLRDASADPSMGLFLNLVGNAASNDPMVHPNQNYARELMQLFSLGDVMLNDDGSVQTDSTGHSIATYDQATILDLSRVFTGWDCDHTVDPVMAPFGCNYALPMVANEALHDTGQKVLFGTVVLPSGQTAAADRSQAIHAIFNHQNVPPFVSNILIQRLVKSNPSPAYINRMSKVFEDDGSGVRGNLAALVRAILLDPEARAGDSSEAPNDGFLQEPLLFETFGMNLLGIVQVDGQPTYVPGQLGEDFDYAPTVFGFYSPTSKIPGTNVLSPEFGLLNNLSLIQKSQYWWVMIQGQIDGFPRQPNYLYSTFTNVPDMLDALNHLLYHGRMSVEEKTAILTYCGGMDPANVQAQLDAAVFLAGNGDSYNVSH